MPSGREQPPGRLQSTVYAAIDDLPAEARSLFGGDFFSTLTWYRTVVQAALPQGARAAFVTFHSAGAVCAVFPMMFVAGGFAALTTPYTCRWRPLFAAGLNAAARRDVWRLFAIQCRRFATVRLDALDAEDAAAIAAGLRGSGIVPLAFDHFGNWHGRADEGWANYLAGRPGHVREALRRRGRQVARAGGTFALVHGPDVIEAGITAYEEVYARSWKEPEPFPAFNAALMRACARDGSLRLGLLTQDKSVLAAQLWVVQGRWAAVLKLAHDEAAKALSPGTLLTAWMIEALLTQDGVTELDFGRGDDPYKQAWTGARRQRMGLVLASPWHAAGALAVVRHLVGKIRKNFFFAKKKQKTLVN